MNSFIRNEQLLTKKVVKEIYKKKIFIAGLGGVGGYAVESLARLGFNNFVFADFDNIEESNLNRQIISSLNNLNKPKTEEFKNRILSINKDAHIELVNEKLDKDNINKLLTNKIDYVVDCIDDIKAKLEIYKVCLDKKIKFISSMGMANKINPQLVKIDKLSKTSNDKLAKKMRELCKKERLNLDKIKVVYSIEPPYQKESKNLPSIVLVPASAGLNLAYYILDDIIKSTK